jgi:hypothetical protein
VPHHPSLSPNHLSRFLRGEVVLHPVLLVAFNIMFWRMTE